MSDPDRNIPLGDETYRRSTSSDYHQQFDGDSEDWQPIQTDGDILNAISLLLRQYDDEYDFDLQIDVKGGVVTLRGDMDNPSGIAQIEQAVQSVDGVVRVESHLS